MAAAIRVLPGRRIRQDATAILVLHGAEPARAVAWEATGGTVEALGTYTDGVGRAFAIFTPAVDGEATVTATVGDSGA
jgi:hypothetical protein